MFTGCAVAGGGDREKYHDTTVLLDTMMVAEMHWSELAANVGTLVVGISACIGAIAGLVWSFRDRGRDKAQTSTTWLTVFYENLYHSGKFDQVRIDIEYNYENVYSRLLVKRLKDRQQVLSSDEQFILRQLDDFLNLFEIMFSLEDRKQIRPKDAMALVEYWINLFRREDRAELRNYIQSNRFSWEKLSERLKTTRVPLLYVPKQTSSGIAFEGSLLDFIKTNSDGFIVPSKHGSSTLNKLTLTEEQGQVFQLVNELVLNEVDEMLNVDFSSASDVIRRAYRIQDRKLGQVDVWYYVRQGQLKTDHTSLELQAA